VAIDLPRRNPTIIAQGFTLPGSQNTTAFNYRGNWSSDVVYNATDLASFVQEVGRPGQLLLCVTPHVSTETFDATQWASLIDYEALIQEQDESGLAARVAALEDALETGVFTKVDGDETQILIRRYTTAEIAALESQVVPQGEFWYCTDSDPTNLVLGDGTTEFDDLINILLNDITPELTELYNDVIEAQIATEAAKTKAQQWASAPPGEEPEAGFESALAAAIRAQSLLRILAGFPYYEKTASYTLTPTTDEVDIKDEFSFIKFAGLAADVDLTLSKDFNKTPGPGGKPAFIAVKVVNADPTYDVNLVTVGAAPGVVAINGTWSGSMRFTVDPPLTAPDVIRAITVPAGIGRVLVITIFDINQSGTSHQVGLTASTGTLSEIGPASAPTGSFASGNRPSARMFKLVLPDSASASTAVSFTFDIPDKNYAIGYKIRSASGVADVGNPAVSSPGTASLTPTASVDAGANSIACFDLGIQGKPVPVTDVGELTVVDSQVTSGQLKNKDVLVVGGQISGAGAGARTLLVTITSDDAPNPKKYAYGVYTFEPETSGGDATAILVGPTSYAPGETGWIYALNDGRTYITTKDA
jgi:hypothetical protein